MGLRLTPSYGGGWENDQGQPGTSGSLRPGLPIEEAPDFMGPALGQGGIVPAIGTRLLGGIPELGGQASPPSWFTPPPVNFNVPDSGPSTLWNRGPPAQVQYFPLAAALVPAGPGGWNPFIAYPQNMASSPAPNVVHNPLAGPIGPNDILAPHGNIFQPWVPGAPVNSVSMPTAVPMFQGTHGPFFPPGLSLPQLNTPSFPTPTLPQQVGIGTGQMGLPNLTQFPGNAATGSGYQWAFDLPDQAPTRPLPAATRPLPAAGAGPTAEWPDFPLLDASPAELEALGLPANLNQLNAQVSLDYVNPGLSSAEINSLRPYMNPQQQAAHESALAKYIRYINLAQIGVFLLSQPDHSGRPTNPGELFLVLIQEARNDPNLSAFGKQTVVAQLQAALAKWQADQAAEAQIGSYRPTYGGPRPPAWTQSDPHGGLRPWTSTIPAPYGPLPLPWWAYQLMPSPGDVVGDTWDSGGIWDSPGAPTLPALPGATGPVAGNT